MIENDQGMLDDASFDFAYQLGLRIVGLNNLKEGSLDGISEDIQTSLDELEAKFKYKYEQLTKEHNESKN